MHALICKRSANGCNNCYLGAEISGSAMTSVSIGIRRRHVCCERVAGSLLWAIELRESLSRDLEGIF